MEQRREKRIAVPQKRLLRYQQKINFIAEKIQSIPEPITGQLAIDATLYRIQTAVDAIMDVIAMLIKDKGEEVSDDYHNIQALFRKKALDKKAAENLTMLNGLRNAIVHKYNTFEEETVIGNIPEIREIAETFLEMVEHELAAAPAKNKKRP